LKFDWQPYAGILSDTEVGNEIRNNTILSGHLGLVLCIIVGGIPRLSNNIIKSGTRQGISIGFHGVSSYNITGNNNITSGSFGV